MVVFLCGTYADLTAEREAVLGAIREMQHDHHAMESFGARPDRPIQTCLDEVRKSDVLVVLAGFLYGSLVPGSELSYTQSEYEEGYRLAKTCLVYVRDEDALIPARYTERDPAKLLRLKAFRDLLEGRHTVVKFRNPPDLARQVAADLARLVEKANRPEPPETNSGPNAQELIARELEIAADIQRQFLPDKPLRETGCEVAGWWVPSRSMGGDYYDFFPYPDGSIAMVIGDVSGKSVPAALIMTALQARVRTLAEYGHTAAELVTRLNRSMSTNMPHGRYVTLFFGLLNTQRTELTYCNAGHNAPMIAREDGAVERLLGSGVPLAIFPDFLYEQYTTPLQPGDSLLLYTDGVSECMDTAGDEFGEDRLAAVLRQCRDRQVNETLHAIIAATQNWSAGQSLIDDLALVVARRT